MASNYTEHYQLPIWAPEDSFLREEFNESHQKIDAALGTITKVKTGKFAGTGEAGLEIDVGFRPKCMILMGYSGRYHLSVITEDVHWFIYENLVYYNVDKLYVEFTDRGFRFPTNTYNQKGYSSYYIAMG